MNGIDALNLLAAGTAAMASDNQNLSWEALRTGDNGASLMYRGKAEAFQSVSDAIRNILGKEQPSD